MPAPSRAFAALACALLSPHRRWPHRDRRGGRLRQRLPAPDPRPRPCDRHGGCRALGGLPRCPGDLGAADRLPLVMALGGAFGMIGLPLPAVETGIALSALVLGLCVALAYKPPLPVAAILVGTFAIFHGYAHGTEMPEASDAVSYALGFVIATGLLHLAGILFGSLAVSQPGRIAVRAAGGLIAAAGGAFLTGLA